MGIVLVELRLSTLTGKTVEVREQIKLWSRLLRGAFLCLPAQIINKHLGLGNIWPECGPDGVTLENRYFKVKDRVENYLAGEVRASRM
jgi:hypothetical protein